MPLTQQQTDELRKLFEKTTQCGWRRYNDNYDKPSSLVACDVANSSGCVIADSIENQSDADFIAAIHNAFPAILETLAEKDTENKRLESELLASRMLADSLGHPVESPCGHSSAHAYSEDGGKTIRCLLCSEASLCADLADARCTQTGNICGYCDKHGVTVDGGERLAEMRQPRTQVSDAGRIGGEAEIRTAPSGRRYNADIEGTIRRRLAASQPQQEAERVCPECSKDDAEKASKCSNEFHRTFPAASGEPNEEGLPFVAPTDEFYRAPAETPLTVEAALKELRGLFPDESFLFVQHEVRHNRRQGRHAITKQPMRVEDGEVKVKIQIGGTGFTCKTLSEAMQAVREYAERMKP